MTASFNTAKPRWWLAGYDQDHSYVYAAKAGYLQPHQEIYGANLFLLREAIQRVGGFDPRLGMSGKRLGYGEEWDLHLRLQKMLTEHLAYYTPELGVFHRVRSEKLSVWWQLREQLSRGRDTHQISCQGRPVFSLSCALVYPILVIKDMLRTFCYGLIARDRRRFPYWQNYVYKHPGLNKHMNQLGQLVSQWRSGPRWLSGSGRMGCTLGCKRCSGEEGGNRPDAATGAV